MAELTFTLTVLVMLALQAAVFVALVFIGVRLANGVAIVPNQREWSRRIRRYFRQLRSAVARARHYDGAAL